jgi:hypothetical protein
MKEMADPNSIPNGVPEFMCRPGHGADTCIFLMMKLGTPGWMCAKNSDFESDLRLRLVAGNSTAKGDNCTGYPDYLPLI